MIIKYPASVLRQKSEPVTDADQDLLFSWIQQMHENLKLSITSGGIAIAAPQVGISKRIVLLDIGLIMSKESDIQVVINPEIINKSEQTCTEMEGCLSLPETIVPVSRNYWVAVKYQDISGVIDTRTFASLAARAVQHEIDHLNGILIIDYCLHK